MSNPSRTDHYIMQVAQEVRRVLSKRPNSIKLSDMKITFKGGEEKPTSKEQASAWAKQRWMGMIGMAQSKPAPNGQSPPTAPVTYY